MKLFLDTHVILWALTDDERLTQSVREQICDPRNTILYSVASLWEIAIKSQKAPDRCPFSEEQIAELCKKAGYLSLDIREKHIQTIRTLRVKEGRTLSNYDPFDRLLLAQAKAEGLQLLSHDCNFANYDEPSVELF